MSIENGRATVTLSNPKNRNAFNDELIDKLYTTFDGLGQNSAVKVIVLAAEGPTFCAGADLNWMRRMADFSHEENLQDAGRLASMLRAIAECPKPTIARVQGDVYAGGMGLVACCDIAVAVESANFSLSEVRLGLIPATISPYVVQSMGPSAARRYFLSAERFDALEALRIGFVHEVVSSLDLDAMVDSIARELRKNSPTAVTRCKKLLQVVSNAPITTGLIDYTVNEIASIRASEEGKEGVQSFLQKRKPAWLN